MTPPTKTPMTAEEFCERYENQCAELIDGQVKESPMPHKEHGFVANNLAYYLTAFIKKHDLGRIITRDSFIKLKANPDTVRGSDIAFFSFEALPRGEVPNKLTDHLPELVVEVRSPSDRDKAVVRKIGDYLNAGVRGVIVIDPEHRSATVFRKGELQQVFDTGDELTVPEILPGFSVAVGALFE